MSIAFAVESDSGLFLIDAGSPGHGDKLARKLAAFSDNPLSLIIITHAHFDHFGCANRLREITGARVAVHADDAEDLRVGRTRIPLVRGWGRVGKPFLPLAEKLLKPQPTRPDIILHGGERLDTLGLPATVVHTPGHTPGSISIVLDNGTAFVSDLAVSRPWDGAQCYYATSWEAIAASLRTVQELEPRLVYSGHSKRPISAARFASLTPPRSK